MKNGVPQKSVLGLMLFNIFFRNMNHLTEHILNKFDGDIKLCVELTCWRERMPSRGALAGLRCQCSLMEFNKSKCKVLHIGQGNPPKIFGEQGIV